MLINYDLGVLTRHGRGDLGIVLGPLLGLTILHAVVWSAEHRPKVRWERWAARGGVLLLTAGAVWLWVWRLPDVHWSGRFTLDTDEVAEVRIEVYDQDPWPAEFFPYRGEVVVRDRAEIAAGLGELAGLPQYSPNHDSYRQHYVVRFVRRDGRELGEAVTVFPTTGAHTDMYMTRLGQLRLDRPPDQNRGGRVSEPYGVFLAPEFGRWVERMVAAHGPPVR